MARRRINVLYSGRVQGVGFRYACKSVAMGFDIAGTVKNLSDGRVELIAEGEENELNEFRQAIRDEGMGRLIKNEEIDWSEATAEFRGFEIIR